MATEGNGMESGRKGTNIRKRALARTLLRGETNEWVGVHMHMHVRLQVVQCRPRIRSTVYRSARLLVQFFVGPDRNGLSGSKITDNRSKASLIGQFKSNFSQFSSFFSKAWFKNS